MRNFKMKNDLTNYQAEKLERLKQEIELLLIDDLPFVEYITLDDMVEGARDGYAYITFPFLNKAAKDWTGKNNKSPYDSFALDYFNLCEGEIIPPDKVMMLITFRDGLTKQIKRKFQLCKHFNEEAKRLIRNFYEFTYDFLTMNFSGNELINKIETLKNNVSIIIDVINSGILSEDYIVKYSSLIKNSSDASKRLIKDTHKELKTIFRQRDSIIKQALIFEKKIIFIEDLLYFALTSEKVFNNVYYREQTQLQNKMRSKEGKVELVQDIRNEKGVKIAEALAIAEKKVGRPVFRNENVFSSTKSQLKE